MVLELTQERLRELLHYDPVTGVFTWLVSAGRVKAGDTAGNLNLEGYRQITIAGKNYRAHRLAWLYTHGAWPKDQIDHRNGVRDDNRWDNLREALHAENGQNIKTPVTNKSGYLGVTWCKAKRKWLARICVDGNSMYLGSFDNPEEAHEAYLAAKATRHPFQPAPRA